MSAFDQDNYLYRELWVPSSDLEIPRNSYQRAFNPKRAKKIAEQFDERIANMPKVSFRNGHYYVFDGQHTISARVSRNNEQPLKIKCKVYFGMTEEEEAKLFSEQTGVSASLTPGEKVRALICANDEEVLAFRDTTEAVGLHLDYDQTKGDHRIACISTALREFRRAGPEIYKEALSHIVKAWNGDPQSLRRENIKGVIRFVELYHEEYNPHRLVNQLRRVDPLTIYREGREMGENLGADKRYMYQVFRIYNGSSKKYALPMKF